MTTGLFGQYANLRAPSFRRLFGERVGYRSGDKSEGRTR
jgi:hypothetical protein